ncbi:uncharacterized protein LOC115927618 [Strongylocentrotus purpuratus]|uniref:Uncharacterized protein n=1 Tax=Strongylocentrotus purpuratus TaxID=7668 RepID=A0A7M7PDM9_STRPU|nr:uncharacterized protein LOC115927618 [Strongylocentrotus purpuratus]
MVPGSNVDLRNAEDFPSEEFITKEINTDKYYHLGLALGLSYQTLDSIQFRSRQHEEAGVYTPNQKAVICMIRYWKCLQHSVSLEDDHLREVWKSVSDSGDSAPVLKQRQGAEKQHDTNVEEVFEGESPRKELRTTPTVGLHDLEVSVSKRYVCVVNISIDLACISKPGSR